ncbi:hypothetical protein [Laribacter hongkongensis]|uniref:hypothetical protein n=1 Tax=Laribacter hongkongensis TaxID=168471 RepID=UPI0011808A14|nr:hypothetical protein [Laribacter hongkongensis]
MITVNGLNAGPSMGRPTGWQKNSHQIIGGCNGDCLEQKPHEDNEQSSRNHIYQNFIRLKINLNVLTKIEIKTSLIYKFFHGHKKIAPNIGAARETRRAPSSRTRHHHAIDIIVSQSALHHLHVDLPDLPRHHASVPFNSGTGIGLPNVLADSRHFAAFFAFVTYAIGVSMVSMVGRSGGVLARAGFQDAGRPTLLRACHPDWSRDGGFNTHLGGHHA